MDSITYVAVPEREWMHIKDILSRLEHLLAPKEEYLTTEQACSMLGITANTFARYRKRYHIKTSQVGRNILTPRSEIDKLINNTHL